MGYKVEIKTADGWVVIPDANVTLDLESLESDEFNSTYNFKATTNTYSFSVDHINKDAYDLITGQKPATENPVFDALVEERVAAYRKTWEF